MLLFLVSKHGSSIQGTLLCEHMGVQPETFLFNSPRRYFCTGWCSMQDMFSSKWELDPGNVFLLQRWWFDPRCDFFFAKVGLIQVVSFSRTTGF